ncbi:hypothetical protein [Dinoroseobacter sp. S124A]|uniref:hypothetical protein n=1 Tax=Dinoroseobacter sp. S124A TaxID=3415128 RepID=UPI003C7D959F
MKETERHPLTLLPRALIEAGYEGISYRRLYNAALNARIPVERNAVGRWTFDPADLPQIAEAMGLQLT